LSSRMSSHPAARTHMGLIQKVLSDDPPVVEDHHWTAGCHEPAAPPQSKEERPTQEDKCICQSILDLAREQHALPREHRAWLAD